VAGVTCVGDENVGMIRIISAGVRHPDRTLAEFRRYWIEHHGPLRAREPGLRRYVQHLTLDEAYGDEPAPTYDAASMSWFDDLDSVVAQPDDPHEVELRTAVIVDDASLFDRSTSWPTDHRKASVIGTHEILVDGATTPAMVKVIFVSARRPGLTLQEFSERLAGPHGSLAAELPGLRRYVQTHALPASYSLTGLDAPTHDGCSELWFDDYRSWKSALGSRAWSAVVDSGETLFARPAAYTVGREHIQKDWT
jgi:uncharacterized protein (TIGR02118 family)